MKAQDIIKNHIEAVRNGKQKKGEALLEIAETFDCSKAEAGRLFSFGLHHDATGLKKFARELIAKNEVKSVVVYKSGSSCIRTETPEAHKKRKAKELATAKEHKLTK